MNRLSQEEINTIHDLCSKYKIKNYTINSDGSIDVDGDVNIHRKELTSIPLRFNELTSLEGCPKSVGGHFYCDYNELTSLEGSPKEVVGDFYCRYNELTSLEGSPKEIGGDFYCNSNKLTSLEGAPGSVGGHFNCNHNQLTSLEGSSKEIGGDFYCYNNNLPNPFNELYNELNEEEKKIFVKYQHDLRIWDNVYDEEQAQLLYEEIKDGLL